MLCRLCMAVMHLPTKFGANSAIQFGVMDIMLPIKEFIAVDKARNTMGVDPEGWGMHPPYNICYIPPSSRLTTGSWGGACNDTERCNRHFVCHKTEMSKILNLLSPHGFFQAQNAPKPVFPLWELTTLPRLPSRLRRGTTLPIPLHSRPLRRLDLAAIPFF